MIVSYTGLLRGGCLQTLWFYAADAALRAPRAGAPAEIEEIGWWRAVTVNADTFERVGPER